MTIPNPFAYMWARKYFYLPFAAVIASLAWLMMPVDAGRGMSVPIKVPDSEVHTHGNWHVVSVAEKAPGFRGRHYFLRWYAETREPTLSSQESSIRESSGVAARVADFVASGGTFPAVAPDDFAVSDIELSTWGGSGGSAGLALTLAGIDIRTPGDLTGGRTVAATGAIRLDGNVLDIGDADVKAEAALQAGVDIFFVPWFNYHQAASAVAGSDMQVIAVSHVSDALKVLCANTNSGVCLNP